MCKLRLWLVMPLLFLLWGCDPDMPNGNTSDTYPDELSQAKYNDLSDEQKYLVANKLLGTMFKGLPVDEFFDISSGMDNLTLTGGADLLPQLKTALNADLTEQDRNYHDMIITDKDNRNNYSLFDIDLDNANGDWPKHLPMARIFQYPLSKDSFDNWVAYILTNTILFSPAEEIDSASIRDVQKVYFKLREDLRQNKTVQQIIARHQRSQENWRRFRSPEDNTREMIEIYLGLFDRDDDVPRASKACQDLYLSDDTADYELLSTGFPNTEPQYVLDTFVVTCGDFYDVVANHPLVIPRVTTVLVENFFYTKTGEERADIVDTIVSGNPGTFQDILKSIIFSEEYLLNNERAKSSEEAFFSSAHQLDWKPFRDVLQDMTSSTNTLSLEQMGWPVMSLKLGRFTGVPLDALSFANYHKGVREILMLGTTGTGTCGSETSNVENSSRCRWANGLGTKLRSVPTAPTANATDQAVAMYDYDTARLDKLTARNSRVMNLSIDDYIDYVFMTVLHRRASSVEMTDLKILFTARGDFVTNVDGGLVIRSGRHDEMAQIILDYASRLPEYYYFLAIN